MEVVAALERALEEITGMAASRCSRGGAHGEFTAF